MRTVCYAKITHFFRSLKFSLSDTKLIKINSMKNNVSGTNPPSNLCITPPYKACILAIIFE